VERIYDILQRIQSLWKELEVTKLNSSEYVALLNQIRVLSDEYVALIDVPKSLLNQNNSLPNWEACARTVTKVTTLF